jgi:hypothetical protein
MKRILACLMGSIVAILLFFLPAGSGAQASELEQSPASEQQTSSECGCDVSYLTGAERNKIVSNLLKTSEFKAKKQEMKKKGYHWNGAGEVEVIQNHTMGDIILVGASFDNEEGIEYMCVYLYQDGTFIYLGDAPAQ